MTNVSLLDGLARYSVQPKTNCEQQLIVAAAKAACGEAFLQKTRARTRPLVALWLPVISTTHSGTSSRMVLRVPLGATVACQRCQH